MCLILFAYRVHPEYPILIAANRDEFYKRPTLSANFWDDYPNVLAGRDLEKLGTWMGITRGGRLAALTNYRNPNEQSKSRSRGEIVSRFLTGGWALEEYAQLLHQEREQFPGYNLLFGNEDELFVYSNVSDEVEKLSPGIYGLSNGFLNTPWPKVVKGKERLRYALNYKESLDEQLFQVLADSDRAPDAELPHTGVGQELERMLSPLFIQSSDYGTRTSTILKISINGRVSFKERTFQSNLSYNEQLFEFELE